MKARKYHDKIHFFKYACLWTRQPDACRCARTREPWSKRHLLPVDQLSTERPLLYISLGTVFNNQPAFFKQCFEAFGESDYQVVLSYGRHVDPATLGPIPDNFLLSPYAPQLEILPRAHVFVTHGGMNSVMESLYYGVPMVVIPQQGEQALTAQRIAEMGLGLTLEKEAVNVITLREAVEQVAHDPACRERVQRMCQITHEAGGYQRAAEAIIQFTKSRQEARLPLGDGRNAESL